MDDDELKLCGEAGKDARAFVRKYMQLRAYADELNARCIADAADAEKWRQVGAPIADDRRAELEALADMAEQAHRQMTKDAERYRWLRQDEGMADWDAAGVLELYAGPDYSRKIGESLDAAIDAAMAPKRDGAA